MFEVTLWSIHWSKSEDGISFELKHCKLHDDAPPFSPSLEIVGQWEELRRASGFRSLSSYHLRTKAGNLPIGLARSRKTIIDRKHIL